MPLTQFAGEFWFPWPPAPTPTELNSYEVMITNVVGAFYESGPAWNVWHRMTSEQAFELPFTTRPDAFVYTFDALVRKVGGIAVTKTVTVNVAAAEGVNP